ncbi:FadR/GntR family transcriptional regulator [Xylophilus sp. GOD-11R]|uniref:FadR/GntR family transcriptional regulator n=1 Tax=Xylophilus sp. GOD-11R TaxID=3089814 RepID=UPI00298C343F|nr:FadR/GntR family transcriptional regulator [Xylophilus sp. GOD-11R]WPB55617.1 FadR/GntR family transcriptional regulator [Xylophilus sp. GOD-11R]
MSMTSLAAQTLQRQISSGTFAPGNMLPGQRELAESMGISRASLREALSMLEALGLVRSMPGKGTLVTRGSRQVAPLPFTPGDAADLQQLWQFRFCMEPATAALAARNMRADQAPRLWGVQARLEDAALTSDMVSASTADLDFHHLIAALSGNGHLVGLMSSFEPDIGRAVALPFAEADRIHDVLREHRAIAAAICLGDADGARLAMQQHLRASARTLGLVFVEP